MHIHISLVSQHRWLPSNCRGDEPILEASNAGYLAVAGIIVGGMPSGCHIATSDFFWGQGQALEQYRV